jgi:hypothetical protein
MLKPYAADFAVVTTYFNPCGFKSLRRNYEVFRGHLSEAGVRLFTVECAFFERPFELQADLQLRSNSILFQKERLFNLGAVQLLQRGWHKIAFFDCDIVFKTEDWIQAISNALERHMLVQCFSTCDMMYSDRTIWSQSVIRRFHDAPERWRMDGHHGCAWAARSDLLKKIGWYEMDILGSGDTCFALGSLLPYMPTERWLRYALDMNPSSRYTSLAGKAHYLLWAEQFAKTLGRDVGYADAALLSLPHGSLKNRNYVERHRMLANFNPYTDISVCPGLPLEWTGANPPLEQQVTDYFVSRREDALYRF